jgi:hypothetical protein
MKLAFRYLLFILLLGLVLNCKSGEKAANNLPGELAIPLRIQQLENGHLERIDSFPSKYVDRRNVDIWLPSDYSAEKKYAVLYMHDGQRLFTGEADRKGREMMVDETASRLMQEGKIEDVIVVGIHSIGRRRHSNYFPQKPFEALPQKLTDSLMRMAKAMQMNVKITSDNYLKFIVEELKPFIDTKYSTKPDFQNTIISGASMGGLISMYAVCEYPNVFGGAACLSTHWPGLFPSDNNPIPAAFFNYMRDKLPSPETHKFYFDFGTEGMDRFYGEFEDEVNAVFAEKGYSSDSFINNRVEGGNHSEEFWSKRFDVPLLFLLKK